MSFGFSNLKKRSCSKEAKMSGSENPELHGFVCPECMIPFSSSEELTTHFKSHEIIENIPSSTPARDKTSSDKTNGALYTKLLDEMSQHNNVLLEQISSHSRRICELETALGMLINGSPVSPDFSFSDRELKRKVDAFLENQTQFVIAKSELEVNRQELTQKSEEIDRLKEKITRLEESERVTQNLDTCVGSGGDLNPEENMAEQQLENELALCKGQLRLACDEITNLRAQLEALRIEQSSVVQQTPSDAISSLKTELESAHEELNSARSALDASEARCTELTSRLNKQEPVASLVSAECQTEPEVFASTESTEHETSTSTDDQTVKLVEEVNRLSAELKNVQALLTKSQSCRQSEHEAAENRISSLTESLRTKQVEWAEAQSLYETRLATASTESNRIRAELDQTSTALAQLRPERDSLEKQLQALTLSLESAEQTRTELEQKRHQEQMEWDSTRAELQAQLTQLKQTITDAHAVNDDLEKRCTQLNEQLADRESLVSSFETQLAQQKQDAELQLTEIQAQLQLSKKEVDSLLERLITAEDKCATSQEQLNSQSQEVERLKKAIFELGRENQSLQMLRERVTSRQWTKDDEVARCSSCQAEFSLTNRKHHCRQCGGIFCHGCSAQRALIAACKDPVRVCGPCYAELSGSH